jgi:hypothetical protein
MALIITVAVILLWILIYKIAQDIEKNKTGNLIRHREVPSKCPECGYKKWALQPRWISSQSNRSICRDCWTKETKVLQERREKRRRDIEQNPFGPRYIPLENGGYAIVENRDYDWISQYNWYKNKDGYAVTKGYWGERVPMHRLVKGLKYVKGYHVHHKNHNRLDNRRKNLMRTSAKRHQQIHS